MRVSALENLSPDSASHSHGHIGGASALVDELERLEKAGDLSAALRLVASRSLTPSALGDTAIALYVRGLGAIPFILATKLLDGGFENILLRALAAHLALRLGQAGIAQASAARLSQLLASASAVERSSVRALLDPLLPLDVVGAFRDGNNPLVRAYTQLWGTLEPEAIDRLTLPQPGYKPDVERFKQAAGDDPPLGFKGSLSDAPPSARKVVLALRQRWMPERPTSREHDMPVRFEIAGANYGWTPIRHDLRSFENPALVVEDYRAIAAICRESNADLLILDEFQPSRADGATGDILRTLRRERPALKIMSVYFDPWLPQRWDEMEAAAAYLDGVWSQIVTPVWQQPAFQGKLVALPFPFGGRHAGPSHREPGLQFAGGVEYTNWDRALWLAAIAQTELPVKRSVSNHFDNNLSAIESYRAYMKRVAGSEAVLNFARRFNGFCPSTGRSFEALATGSLLVQERCDDLDLYLTPGRHYLRFETLTDLFDIAHLVATEPAFVENIRRQGAALFDERYADDRLFAYLDQFLFCGSGKA